MNWTDEDKTWLADLLRASETRLAKQIEQLRAEVERLNAKIEQVEASLLTEFPKGVYPTEARLRTSGAMLRVYDLEMEALTERLKKMEDRDAA